jgi:hypothetical protein
VSKNQVLLTTALCGSLLFISTKTHPHHDTVPYLSSKIGSTKSLLSAQAATQHPTHLPSSVKPALLDNSGCAIDSLRCCTAKQRPRVMEITTVKKEETNFSISVSYPRIVSKQISISEKMWNQDVATWIQKQVKMYEQPFHQTVPGPGEPKFQLKIECKPTLTLSSLLSLRCETFYDLGLSHTGSYVNGLNYFLGCSSIKQLNIEDFFAKKQEAIRLLDRISINILTKKHADWVVHGVVTHFSDFDYSISSQGFTIHFPPGTVQARIYGAQEAFIYFEQLTSTLQPSPIGYELSP